MFVSRRIWRLRALTALIDLFSEEVIGNDEAVLTARD
jgi:hypothetical protein